MFNFLKKILYRLFFLNFSFSQEGEDRILERIFEAKINGFYIDIGCNHPRRFSNTYLFYLKGWSGICIDPNADFIHKYSKVRSRDTFINVGVSDVESELEFFKYNDDALNTFDRELTEWRLKNTPYKLIETKSIKVLPLSIVLTQTKVPSVVDFMNIDVEGLDLNVLRSNDWTRVRPKIILVENLKQVNNPIHDFLSKLNYTMIAMTGNTLFYKLKE